MKTLIVSIITIALFQGCDAQSECNIQKCQNGVMIFNVCNRAGLNSVILVDENGEALRCSKKINQ